MATPLQTAIDRETAKLARQEQQIEATKALIDLLRAEVAKKDNKNK